MLQQILNYVVNFRQGVFVPRGNRMYLWAQRLIFPRNGRFNILKV